MWVAVVDELPPASSGPDFYPLRIGGYRHATSTNGTTFTTTGTLSFVGGPFETQIFGSAYGEPPWFYPKAVVWDGRYTLFMWTINGFFGPPSLGDYDYNISVNDVGTNPATLALTHAGPVGPVPGNDIADETAGIFGVVNGIMYYDNNSLLGRAAITDNGAQPFPSAASTGPWRVTGTNAAVADRSRHSGSSPANLSVAMLTCTTMRASSITATARWDGYSRCVTATVRASRSRSTTCNRRTTGLPGVRQSGSSPARSRLAG